MGSIPLLNLLHDQNGLLTIAMSHLTVLLLYAASLSQKKKKCEITFGFFCLGFSFLKYPFLNLFSLSMTLFGQELHRSVFSHHAYGHNTSFPPMTCTSEMFTK